MCNKQSRSQFRTANYLMVGTVTTGPPTLAPASDIENKSITAPKVALDRMSVSEIQNQWP